MIRALGSPLGPRLKRDLATDLYSASTPLACYDESNQWISFNRLNKSTISLSMAIEASDSPLGTRPERDLASDLYSGSTLIAIKDESNHRISFRRLQEIYNITTRGYQGMGLSFRNPSGNRSRYTFILWLYPGSQLQWDQSTRLERPFQVMKHLADLSLSWGRLAQ
jgi:hypothetical protein